MAHGATATGSIRILIVSEVRLVREALSLALGSCDDITVLGSVARVHEFTTYPGLDDAIVLLELPVLQDRAALEALRAAEPRVRLAAFAVADADNDILACAEAGLAGYVLSDGTVDDLLNTVRCIARNELPVSPRAAAMLFRQVGALSARGRATFSTHDVDHADLPSRAMHKLTSREAEVLQLVETGISNKEIAARLHIEVTTVKNHVHHILEKMQLTRRGQAAAAARARGSQDSSMR